MDRRYTARIIIVLWSGPAGLRRSLSTTNTPSARYTRSTRGVWDLAPRLRHRTQ